MNGDSLDEAFQEAATWLKSQKNLNLPQDQLLKVL